VKEGEGRRVKDVCETGDERLESEGGRKSREYEIQGE